MVRKRRPSAPPGPIRKTDVRDQLLTFSFRYFIHDDDVCPKDGHPGDYWLKLLERLKHLSDWTVTDFVHKNKGRLHIHPIDWKDTSRPGGFSSPAAQAQEGGQAWQFSPSVNAHGRVVGFFIGNVFHIVWLDIRHQVYPMA